MTSSSTSVRRRTPLRSRLAALGFQLLTVIGTLLALALGWYGMGMYMLFSGLGHGSVTTSELAVVFVVFTLIGLVILGAFLALLRRVGPIAAWLRRRNDAPDADPLPGGSAPALQSVWGPLPIASLFRRRQRRVPDLPVLFASARRKMSSGAHGSINRTARLAGGLYLFDSLAQLLFPGLAMVSPFTFVAELLLPT